MDEPEKFEIALNSLECYKTSRRDEDHYLILGYGSDEEDNYMNMLIAMFIQKGKLHVSFVQGGYKSEDIRGNNNITGCFVFSELHDCIGQHNRWELIAMHSEDRCELCSSEKASPKWVSCDFINQRKL